MAIYLERDGQIIDMTKRQYDAEDVLQELIERHPGLLVDGDAAQGTRLVLIEREVSIGDAPDSAGRWSLDHLYVDEQGVPTLVEVKRSSDTRIRREVVGQLLEYAANGPRYWPPGSIRAQFEARCTGGGVPPDDVLRRALGDETDLEEWWGAVDTNLREGRLRLLFVADEISHELKAIIEFLNEQMTRTTVLGIELPQYTDEAGNDRMFVPVVLGATERADSVKADRKLRRWTLEEWMERHSEVARPEAVNATKRLLAWANGAGVRVAFGTAMHNPAMKLERHIGGRWLGVFRLYIDGTVEINFGHLAPPLDDAAGWRALAERLEAIDGVTIPPERLGKFPAFSSDLLRSDEQLRTFVQAVEWAFAEMQRTATVRA